MWLLLIRIVKYYRDVKLKKTETLYKYFNPVGLFIIGPRKRRPTNNMSGLVRHPFILSETVQSVQTLLGSLILIYMFAYYFCRC